MRLSEFISQYKEAILLEWDAFAKTIVPAALTMNVVELRDHAAHILDAVLEDLHSPQTLAEQTAKSHGRGTLHSTSSYAENHATARLGSGYSIDQLISEYRALRASVLRLWAANSKDIQTTDIDDITRFNEAIDQALSESVAVFSHESPPL